MRPLGFTLSELLISLAILGVIATFTIPKVLNTQADSERKAVLKETVTLVNTVFYNGLITGNIYRNPDNTWNTFWALDQVNAIKICNGNATMLGCNNAVGLPHSTARGFILPSGAVVVGPGLNLSGDIYQISIDWNGEEGPNTEGDDWIGLIICMDAGGCIYNGRTLSRGHVVGNRWYGPGNYNCQQDYEDIFSN